jgi:hypothetical protein
MNRALLPLILVLGAAPAAAERSLYVVTPAGNLYATPPSGGAFTLLAATQVPLHSVQQVGDVLWLGSPTGSLLRYELITGALLTPVPVPSDAAALAFHDGDLLVGGSAGRVLRVDVETGVFEQALQSAWPIEALAVDGDTLYASTPVGQYQEADLASGSGFELAGTGFGSVNALGQTHDELYVAELDGVVRVYDKPTDALIYAYPVDNDATSMMQDGPQFLIGGSNGTIQRVAEISGFPIATYTAPEPVAALWLAQPVGVLSASHEFAFAAAGALDLQFDLAVPLEHAGDGYRILGSLTGSEPGLDLGDLHLALQPDAYFGFTLSGGMDPFTTGFGGVFDAAGRAQASFLVPPQLLISTAGLTVHHAFYVFEPGMPGVPVAVSDTVELLVL